jgi:hypothetical protein
MFDRFTPEGVLWSDGQHEAVDTVIFATGYRPNLPYLAGLGVLDEAGGVRQREGASITVPGLYFVGLPRQRSTASATLRGVGPDAKVVVNHLRRYLEAQQSTDGRPTPAVQPLRTWVSRSSELITLISLITFALKGQLASQRLAAPRLVGEALVRSLIVGAGFWGFGHAASLYSR